MSTYVVKELSAKPGRGDDVLALLLELSRESRDRPGCEAISIRRNQDDPNNVIGDIRWATRQHHDVGRFLRGVPKRDARRLLAIHGDLANQ